MSSNWMKLGFSLSALTLALTACNLNGNDDHNDEPSAEADLTPAQQQVKVLTDSINTEDKFTSADANKDQQLSADELAQYTKQSPEQVAQALAVLAANKTSLSVDEVLPMNLTRRWNGHKTVLIAANQVWSLAQAIDSLIIDPALSSLEAADQEDAGSTETSCLSGGSRVLNLQDKDNNQQVSAGDVAVWTFKQCKGLVGADALTGTWSMTVSQLQGALDAVAAGSLQASINMDIKLTSADSTESYKGQSQLGLAFTPTTASTSSRWDYSLTSDSLSSTYQTPNQDYQFDVRNLVLKSSQRASSSLIISQFDFNEQIRLPSGRTLAFDASLKSGFTATSSGRPLLGSLSLKDAQTQVDVSFNNANNAVFQINDGNSTLDWSTSIPIVINLDITTPARTNTSSSSSSSSNTSSSSTSAGGSRN